MLRNRLMTVVAVLVLLGAIAGCGGDIGQSPEEAKVDLERTVEESIVVLERPAEEAKVDLERTVEETIAVLERPAEEANLDLEQPAEETNTFTIKGWVTVDAYRYDAATGTYIHFYHDESSNIITTIGNDWIAQQLGGVPAANPAKWISLSCDIGTPAAEWTQIPTEIAADGLERAVGDYAHTPGTANWTITETFTATAAHTAVQLTSLQWALAPLGGNLMAANEFTSVTLASDDSLTITWTLTLGP